MTFLTDSPDFDGWIYSTEDLLRAREVLVQLLERVAPEWLDQPGGYIAKQWYQGGLVPVSILIDLAHTLHLAREWITSKSVPAFEMKVRQMMWAEQQDQYEELLTEFQIVAELSQRVSPISIEPLVAKEESGGPEQPPSPDLGVLLPEGPVLLEVTVSRFEFLREWHRAVDEVSRRITHEIGKAAAKLSFRLDFPIGFRYNSLRSPRFVIF